MKELVCYEGLAKKTKEYPDDATAITNNDGFLHSKQLTSVVIPNWVTHIDGYAFAKSSIIFCEIPNSVLSIGGGAFCRSSIQSIIIPSSITKVKQQTFSNCTSLVKVVIPNSVTSLDIRSFYNCSSLTHITIPEAATVEDSAFDGCTLLLAKSSIYNMSIVEYYRDFYNERIRLRVAVLTSLKVYQEMHGQSEPTAQGNGFELIEGHLNGPRAYHKITAFELWREICMFL